MGEGAPGLPDPATLESVVLPTVHDGQRAPGLRFGEPRVMAMLASVASFAHVVGGLTNPGLCRHMVELHNPAYTSRQASYDLRRLRLKGLVERVPHTRTYRVTEHGRRIAAFFTRLAARVVVPVLTEFAAIDRPPRTAPSPLVSAWHAYDAELAKLAGRSPKRPDARALARPPHDRPTRRHTRSRPPVLRRASAGSGAAAISAHHAPTT